MQLVQLLTGAPLRGLWAAAPALRARESDGVAHDCLSRSLLGVADVVVMDWLCRYLNVNDDAFGAACVNAAAMERLRAGLGSPLRGDRIAAKVAHLLRDVWSQNESARGAMLAGGVASFAERLLLRHRDFHNALVMAAVLAGTAAPLLADDEREAVALTRALARVLCDIDAAVLHDASADALQPLSAPFYAACVALVALTSSAPYLSRPHDVAASASASPAARAAAAALWTACDGADGGVAGVLLRCAVGVSVLDDAGTSLVAPGRLFRALTALPRGAPGRLSDDDAARRADDALRFAWGVYIDYLRRRRHRSPQEAASACVRRSDRLLTEWMLMYAALPRAFVDAKAAERRPRGHVVAFCVAPCCVPRCANARIAPPPLLMRVINPAVLSDFAAAAEVSERAAAALARFVAYVAQGWAPVAGGDAETDAAPACARAALLSQRLSYGDAKATRAPRAACRAHLQSGSSPSPPLSVLAGARLTPPVADDADEVALCTAAYAALGVDSATAAQAGGDDLSDEEDHVAGRRGAVPRARVHTALLIDRALCALEDAERADGALAAGGMRARAAAADAAMAALLAEEEADQASKCKGKADASKRGGGSGGGAKGKNKGKGATKAPLALPSLPPPPMPLPAATADEELDANAMARTLRRGQRSGAVVSTSRLGASVVVAASAPIVEPPASSSSSSPLRPRVQQQQAQRTVPPAPAPLPARASVPQGRSAAATALPPPPPQTAPPGPMSDAELAALFPWLNLSADAAPAAPRPSAQPPAIAVAITDETHEDDHLCVVCLDAPRDTPLPGCADAHPVVLCAACVARLLAAAAPACPLCRAPAA